LKSGETIPDRGETELSGEVARRPPSYIVHRELKDPRTLRLLDPACGSMHFGLYAFDLFEVIYEEAWDLSELGSIPGAASNALRDVYSSRDAFVRDIPKLIVENNIHGIDIDPRAVQIAGLSLWLRAQRAWGTRQVSSVEHPRIDRSQIVCAEPMPGDAKLLEQFAGTLDPPLVGQVVKEIFIRMQLAGDAGSLLKIEEEISVLVKEAKRQWQEAPVAEQEALFPGVAKPTQGAFRFDRTGISEEQFWDTIEQRVYEALHSYSEKFEDRYSHRMFVDDTVGGFAFIDLCRRRYDVVVMNPPFGESAKDAKDYLSAMFPRTKNDVYAAFVEEGIARLAAGGRLGAITSRSGFFLTSFQRWREEVLLEEARPVALADLGYGVLDSAMVETAAYVLEAPMP